MQQQEIETKVIEAIKTILNDTVEEITMATNLKEDLSINSMDTMNLAMELEDEFDVTIPDEAVYGLTTVQSIVDKVVEVLADEQ